MSRRIAARLSQSVTEVLQGGRGLRPEHRAVLPSRMVS